MGSTRTVPVEASTSGAPGWQLRYGWQPEVGVNHPGHTFEKAPSREVAIEHAWNRWPKNDHGVALTEIAVRELPDGEWEHVLPVAATCEVRPGGYIGEEETSAP